MIARLLARSRNDEMMINAQFCSFGFKTKSHASCKKEGKIVKVCVLRDSLNIFRGKPTSMTCTGETGQPPGTVVTRQTRPSHQSSDLPLLHTPDGGLHT
ncbi:hypothetical protein RRG08_031049 [Elysia crispata]|uniref:Uncharacterized protein n=1 Tax=Elysia crispata TaxID=231223 RepID=A0AAE1DFS5_9GAST|nr:hypothetical protein RRG08_031049 [Elysia crispata]